MQGMPPTILCLVTLFNKRRLFLNILFYHVLHSRHKHLPPLPYVLFSSSHFVPRLTNYMIINKRRIITWYRSTLKLLCRNKFSQKCPRQVFQLSHKFQRQPPIKMFFESVRPWNHEHQALIHYQLSF